MAVVLDVELVPVGAVDVDVPVAAVPVVVVLLVVVLLVDDIPVSVPLVVVESVEPVVSVPVVMFVFCSLVQPNANSRTAATASAAMDFFISMISPSKKTPCIGQGVRTVESRA